MSQLDVDRCELFLDVNLMVVYSILALIDNAVMGLFRYSYGIICLVSRTH